MAELEKIVRVLKKRNPALPHAALLVLDATTGQNAHEQVRVFQEMVAITGLVVTKLDGSAKGGVVVGTCGPLRPADPSGRRRGRRGGFAAVPGGGFCAGACRALVVIASSLRSQ